MKKTIGPVLVALLFLIVLLSGCAPASTPVPPTPAPTITLTPIPPTDIPVPTATPTELPTAIPTPTNIPGKVVIPITSMKNTIPWLPGAYDPKAVPATMFYAFNVTKPPFDNKLVRQAFAAAIDKEAIVAIATRLYVKNAQPATTLLPPQILGRYLYNEVGIPFDPMLAKELLGKAGYSDVASFPKMTLYISASKSAAPGVYQQTAEAVVKMWKENLGIDVTIKSIGFTKDLTAYLGKNPNGYEVYRLAFSIGSDQEMDPTSLIEIFSSNNELNSGFNYAHFNNDEFEKLLTKARAEPDPAKRQILYIDAERILCEEQVAIIPLYYWTAP